MLPLEFETYYKIVGSIGVVSLASNLFSYFKLIEDIKTKKNKIESKRQFKTYGQLREFHPKIEKEIKKVDKINRYNVGYIILLVITSLSIISYAVCKDIPYIFNTKCYINTISIISYSSIAFIYIYFAILNYYFFRLYFRIIHYNTLNDIYNYKKP